jgi:hypothetical protein
VRALLIAAALAAGGCLDYDALSGGAPDLAGDDLRPADAAAVDASADLTAAADLTSVDLASVDLAGVDFAVPPDLMSTDLAAGPVCGAAPGTCTASGLVFCEDFEGASGLAGKWQGAQIIPAATGTVGIDSALYCRVAHALHVTTEGGSDVASLLSLAFSTSGPTYVRGYLYFTDAPSENEVFSVWGVNNDRGGLGVHGGEWTAMWNGVATASAGSPAVATGQWLCVELEIVPGMNGALHAWINDAPVAALDLSKTNVSQPNRVQLGLTPLTTQPAGDTWFDEVAVDTKYVPCSL